MERLRNLFTKSRSDEFPIIRNFMFCIETDKYESSCCCSLFPLKTAIYFFGTLDIFIGVLCSFIFLANVDDSLYYAPGEKFPSLFQTLISSLMVVPAIYALSGLSQSSARKVAYYYFAKVVQTIIRPFLEIWANKAYCTHANICKSGFWLALILITFLILALHAYEARLFFSYTNLVTKGEIVLANNGQEVVEAMNRVRGQAAALNSPSYANVVVGSPISPELCKTDIVPGQQVPLADSTKYNT